MLDNLKNKSFFIIDYDKKYLKQIVELFINAVHNINKKDYTKEQLNTWANPKYDLRIWKKDKIDKIKVDASITAKPFFEKFGFIEVRKNVVKRNNVELINFSMEMDLKK